jgi:WD repeat-containing protein 59
MKDRAFILRQLRFIREQRRPCLEACLRFLLFENADEHIGVPASIHSVPSSDDEASQKVRDLTVSLLRNNKNLAEPRTSQGIFGPNG